MKTLQMTLAIGPIVSVQTPAAIRIFGREKQMNCAEFQSDLPLIIDSGGNPEHDEHLRTCAVCLDLVNDLRYIADQAKLLVTMAEPSPKVWSGIEEKLRLEGLVKTSVARPVQRIAEPSK